MSSAADTVDWRTSWLGLCCHHACCLSLCCPCAIYYKTSHLVEQTDDQASCCESVLGGCCFFGGYNQRMMLREKYNLKGSVCTDFCIHFWCQCLALGQVYREARAWAEDVLDESSGPATRFQPPGAQEMKSVEPQENNSKLGMTPTERYEDLLVENALANSKLGKKSSKTSAQLAGEQVVGSVVVRGDSFGSHDAKEAALALMSVSKKALELHANFADEAMDSSKFLKTPKRGEGPGSSSGDGTGEPLVQPSNDAETPVPDAGEQECGLTEARSIAEVGEVGKLMQAVGSGHYVVRQPQSLGKGGVLSLGQGDPRMNSSTPAVPTFTSPPLVKSRSGMPPSRKVEGGGSQVQRPSVPLPTNLNGQGG
ncbi:hypothetical protein BSKO_07051 [Bryopsis sp. KO-2023]|nr:hypothetical protein BSKO_07051 [Bryopsis sp. KO-2023]